eukprot:15650243-Heterocapsa_arctica.AAC.1
MESRDTGSCSRSGHVGEAPGERVVPLGDPVVGAEAHVEEPDASGEAGDGGGVVSPRGGGIDDEALAEKVGAAEETEAGGPAEEVVPLRVPPAFI